MERKWIAIAAITGLVAVGLGAFGAHGLKDRIEPDQLAAFEVGVRYQMYHALALLGVAWVMARHPSRAASAAGASMLLGVLLFSGSLYGLSLTPWRWLGPITPIGGLLLMVGWALLAVAVMQGKKSKPVDTA